MIKNKRYLSSKTKWIIGSSISILSTVPLISISAVACSSQKENLVIPSVQISNEPTNQIGYINETAVNPPITNLAIFNINT